jgi:hypothetical protein
MPPPELEATAVVMRGDTEHKPYPHYCHDCDEAARRYLLSEMKLPTPPSSRQNIQHAIDDL